MKQKVKKISEEKIEESSDSDADDSDYERKRSSEELKELKEFHKKRKRGILTTNNLIFDKEPVEPIHTHTHNYIPLLSQ